MLAALPLPNRAASSLVTLAPGVLMIDDGAGTAEDYPVFSVAGGGARNQYFMLAGGNANIVELLSRNRSIRSKAGVEERNWNGERPASGSMRVRFGTSRGRTAPSQMRPLAVVAAG